MDSNSFPPFSFLDNHIKQINHCSTNPYRITNCESKTIIFKWKPTPAFSVIDEVIQCSGYQCGFFFLSFLLLYKHTKQINPCNTNPYRIKIRKPKTIIFICYMEINTRFVSFGGVIQWISMRVFFYFFLYPHQTN